MVPRTGLLLELSLPRDERFSCADKAMEGQLQTVAEKARNSITQSGAMFFAQFQR
jgi:hypothetical protein